MALNFGCFLKRPPGPPNFLHSSDRILSVELFTSTVLFYEMTNSGSELKTNKSGKEMTHGWDKFCVVFGRKTHWNDPISFSESNLS